MLSNDPRMNYAYAYGCARRRWAWLIALYPQDARQTISLAVSEANAEAQAAAERSEFARGVNLARQVDRAMYRFARSLGWTRDQKGLPRGSGRGARWVRMPELLTCQACGGQTTPDCPHPSGDRHEGLQWRNRGRKRRNRRSGWLPEMPPVRP